MTNKKVTDIMLDRIKYFVNAIENGEYEPKGYEFTIVLHSDPGSVFDRVLKIDDSHTKEKY